MFYYYGSSTADEIENPFKPEDGVVCLAKVISHEFSFSYFVSGWNPFHDHRIPCLNKEATHPVGK